MTKQTEGSTAALDTATHYACVRTRLAMERTMMAWVRTATSLITFGFAIYKFFQFELKPEQQVETLVSPREFGILMILFGLVSLLLGTVQHVISMRQLRAQWPDAPRSVAAVLAALLAVLGLGTLITALFRQ